MKNGTKSSRQSGSSPWLLRDPQEPAMEPEVVVEDAPGHDEILGLADRAEGPALPLHTAADAARAVAAGPPSSSTLTVMGLHGGSGASTLAELLGQDVLDTPPWVPSEPLPGGWVVAVARIHARGLLRTTQLAKAWSQADLGSEGRLLGVVLVDDGPQPSKAQVKRARLLTGAVPATWRIPWVEAWRTGVAAEAASGAPRRARSTAKSIRAAHGDAVNRKDCQ